MASAMGTCVQVCVSVSILLHIEYRFYPIIKVIIFFGEATTFWMALISSRECLRVRTCLWLRLELVLGQGKGGSLGWFQVKSWAMCLCL